MRDEELEQFYNSFPETFSWGSTSSACCIEGGWDMDGRKMSWWDTSLRKNSQDIIDQSDIGESGKYARFQEDVKLLKEMNATCYKFSLSWSLIFPYGSTTHVNKSGVEYYNLLIDTLLGSGIRPIIVLYHWDFPQELFEKHPFNWSDKRVIKAFGNYAQFCFKQFGEKVKHWIPIHDPWKHSVCGCEGNGGSSSPIKVFRNLIKAHSLALRIYNKEFRSKQGGKIGVSINSKCLSKRDFYKNESAVPDYASCNELRPCYNPNVSPDYGTVCWEEFKRVQSDFVDLTNEDISEEMSFGEIRNSNKKRNSHPQLSSTRVILNAIKNDLKNPEVLLCGKGQQATLGLSLNELKQKTAFKLYAGEILKSIVLDGCNVVGFLLPLIDSWKWENGFSLSYGLHQVKLENPVKYRVQRVSIKYIAKLYKMHGLSKYWDIDFERFM